MSLRPTATESSHPISAWLPFRSFLDVGAGVVELLDIGRGEAQPRGATRSPSWSSRVALAMGAVMLGRAISHARATWAGVTP